MIKRKPIIFRSLVLTIGGRYVSLSSEGVHNLLYNLSISVEVSQCKASNPADTFESLVGAGFEAQLNKTTRAALAVAAIFAAYDVSLLDAFVLGEPQRLKLATPSQVPALLNAASGFGYTEAVQALMATKPAASALDSAVYTAAECGRNEVLELLLEAGAATTHTNSVKRLRSHS